MTTASRPLAAGVRPAGRPAWQRWPGLALAWCVGVPIVKALEVAGVWPRLVSRAMARAMSGAADYRPSAHDVLICSYFKSGTNWTMQMALQVAHRGHAEFEHIHDLVPWLEMPAEHQYAVPLDDETVRLGAPTGLRVIKTHLPFDSLPFDSRARYICVVRDPKDVFVSSYHFVRASVLGPLMPSVERWLDLYLSPDTFCGSWAEHLASAWRNRHLDNVLFMTYEEMKADLPGTARRIAASMGVELRAEELDDVVRQSSHAYMKAIGHKFDAFKLAPPWTDPRGAMVRRGERGSASELLGPVAQRRIDDYWRAELARLGCDFPYDEAFNGDARTRESITA